MKISGGKKKKRKKHRKEKRKRDDPPLKTNQYEYVAHADDTLMSNSGKANFPQVDDALLSNPPPHPHPHHFSLPLAKQVPPTNVLGVAVKTRRWWG
jgi:hypothetical protein